MKIIEIACGGFKNLGNTTINFTENQITAVIAPNNFGKSNLLECLNFAIDFILAPSRDRKKMMGFIPAIPINKSLENENFKFEITFEYRFNDEILTVNYSFSFAWK